MSILEELNSNVKSHNEILEGNYFYHHNSADLTAHPDPSRKEKRIRLGKSSRGAKSCLEVGFNAGHSALLVLAADRRIKYLGVDIGAHSYTKSAAEILARHFGSRFDFIQGDSSIVLPELVTQNKKYGLIHIDGGHTQSQCLADLRNAIQVSRPFSTRILLDDAQAQPIKDAYEELVNDSILELCPNANSNTSENLLFKVNQRY